MKALVEQGIPVMGHIGLMPQRLPWKRQARHADRALEVAHDAIALQRAGAFAIVIECVPETVAEAITKRLQIPTIGIGAGRFTSGQIQVFHDLVGMTSPEQTPSFVRRFANIHGIMEQAVRQYRDEVKNAEFPGEEHGFNMKNDLELEQFRQRIDKVFQTNPEKPMQMDLR